MKIATVQLVPEFGEVITTIAKIERMLESVKPGDIDLLVLPELALPGYNFPTLRHIKPYLEVQGEGPSSLWARKTALRLHCTVCIGYAEKAHPPSNVPKKTVPSGLDKRYNYNSNIMYGPDGKMVGHYRKNFLYMTDLTWCSESPASNGFFAQQMPPGACDGKKMALGICMDINPYKFSAPFEAYEFATHARDTQADVVTVSMAWTSLALAPEHVLDATEGQIADNETVKYWIKRFKPVVDAPKETLLVMANRAGVEADAIYAGTSLVARVGNGKVEVWDVAGKGEERLVRADTEGSAKYVWDWQAEKLVAAA